MYIKQLPTSNQRFDKLIKYFLKGYQEGDLQLFRNTGLASTPEELTKVYMKNAEHKHHRSKNLRHCIMSFSSEDSNALAENPAILYDLADKYLELRGYNTDALVYGVLHKPDITKEDSIQHYHWHFLISTNKIRSRQSTRVSKADYKRQDIELENYQREKYGDLKSLVYTHPDRTQEKKPKRTAKMDHKAFIADLYNTVADESSHFSDLCNRLEKEHPELTLYTNKKGVVVGAWYKNCKYRLKTYMQSERYEILQELEQLKVIRDKQKERGRTR